MLDRLTLDQMRVLIAVADTGSFSAAARKLRRVQSAISQSVRTLELELGVQLFDRQARVPVLTDTGRIILEEARKMVHGADKLRATAENIASGVEPELTLAVEQLLPSSVLMASLQALSSVFPFLPVTLFTESLGAPEQRLREGVARLAIYPPLASRSDGLETEFLVSIPIVPIVATSHPLAMESVPIPQEHLDQHVQLVLTDRSQTISGRSIGALSSPRSWRFADYNVRIDYALAGFGWCYSPIHLVEGHIAAGRLKLLDFKAHHGRYLSMALHIAHERRKPLGPAGRWLVQDLRERLAIYERAGADAHVGEDRYIRIRMSPA